MADIDELLVISRANYAYLLDEDDRWAEAKAKAIKSEDPTAYWDFKAPRPKKV